ncbi:MAG: D-aminoacyl-tRNA deacylase [Desulfobia sp.]
MRAVVQLVSSASVKVEDKINGAIQRGLVVLLGIGHKDTEKDALYLVDKISNLRIFPDETGKMNLSVRDTNGEVMVVSQFTLWGDCRKGRRPSYSGAAHPAAAAGLYNLFISKMKQHVPVATGEFQAKMQIDLCNEGPVTILLDSGRLF